MSDSSPLLLNMGAEVATAAGMNPVAARATTTGDNRNEFAGILQSVLTPAAQLEVTNPLAGKQLELNPLLFSQPAGSTDQSLMQNGIPLETLPGGKDLPEDEQGLAWLTLLAEYDSQDPDTPRIVMAEGDEQGYQLKDFGPDDLLAVNNHSGEARKPDAALPDFTGQVAAGTGTAPDKAAEKPPELITSLSSPNGQAATQLGQPAITAPENETVADITRAAGARMSNVDHSDAAANQSGGQADNHRFMADKTGPLTEQPKFNIADPDKFKHEAVSSTDGSAVKTVNAALNTSLGTSAYATVSGMGATASGSHSPAPVVAHLTVPPQNPAWGEIVGDRVQWMATQNIQEAKIRLNPPELGLLEVRVQVGPDHQTHISFSSPHSQVRDALETAVPRLREMFVDSGLSLGDVNVSHHSMSGQGQADHGNNGTGASGKPLIHASGETNDMAPPPQLTTRGAGMLDLYA